MKKVFSLLLAVVVMSSMIVSTAYAANGPYITWDLEDNLVVAPGEEVVITLDSAAKTITSDSFYVQFDTNLFECTYIRNSEGKGTYSLPYWYVDEGDDYENGWEEEMDYTTRTTVSHANTTGKCSFGFANTTLYDFSAVESLIVLKFSAKDVATTQTATFKLHEESGGVNGYIGDSQTVTVTVKPAAPAVDESIKNDDASAGTSSSEANKSKTWNVTVGKDLVGQTLIATLTNTAAEPGNQTQEVTLTFDSGISGDASCVFDVVVYFQDFANAATTSLSIAKAN